MQAASQRSLELFFKIKNQCTSDHTQQKTHRERDVIRAFCAGFSRGHNMRDAYSLRTPLQSSHIVCLSFRLCEREEEEEKKPATLQFIISFDCYFSICLYVAVVFFFFFFACWAKYFSSYVSFVIVVRRAFHHPRHSHYCLYFVHTFILRCFRFVNWVCRRRTTNEQKKPSFLRLCWSAMRMSFFSKQLHTRNEKQNKNV